MQANQPSRQSAEAGTARAVHHHYHTSLTTSDLSTMHFGIRLVCHLTYYINKIDVSFYLSRDYVKI